MISRTTVCLLIAPNELCYFQYGYDNSTETWSYVFYPDEQSVEEGENAISFCDDLTEAELDQVWQAILAVAR